MPNQIYSLNPSTIIVTSSFEENVKKLESVCIPPRHIIDICIESQKYAQNIHDMTNPMEVNHICHHLHNLSFIVHKGPARVIDHLMMLSVRLLV